MHVEIHTIKDGRDSLAGVLRLQGGTIVAEPDSALLQGILDEPLYDRKADEVVTSEAEPRRFLELLRFQYTSAYLRVGKPEELEDAKGDGKGDGGGV